MPLPLLAAGVSAAGSLLGQIFQGGQNRKAFERQAQYNTQMYERQRADSLADWNMQNQYNSPEAQMRRFKEAGLNPNLIYGQSNMSQAVRSSNIGSANLSPVNIDTGMIGDAINQYYNVKRAESEIAVNKARIANINADTINKADIHSSDIQ